MEGRMSTNKTDKKTGEDCTKLACTKMDSNAEISPTPPLPKNHAQVGDGGD